jgi:glycosyltransferase involved in cell wall biosynthesis
MNVLQLISSGEGYYGAEQVLVTLSAELARMGACVTVGAFLNHDKPPHLEVLQAAARRGLRTEVIPCQGRLNWDAVLAVRTLLVSHQIDVIHSHGPKANLYARLAGRKIGAILVSTCHSWYFDSAMDRLISWTDGGVLCGFDRVVVVSDTIRPKLRRCCVPNGRIVTIHNGIDCRPYAPLGGAIAKECQWGDGMVVGTAARLSCEKGLPYLLKAAAAVVREFPDATFVIAGDGPEREALLRLAAQLGILPNVRLLGVVSSMPEFYASIDVFVLSSLAEGLPMALIEAMAAGKAVVASSVGSVPVVVQDRKNGLLVRPGDVASLAGALQEVCRDGELRARLGSNARGTVESRFAAAVMTKQYWDLYESTIASRTKDDLGSRGPVDNFVASRRARAGQKSSGV